MSTDYLSRDSFDGAGAALYSDFGALPENVLDPEPDPIAAAAPGNDRQKAIASANDHKTTMASAPGPVVAEAVEASDDNDTATKQTVEMMCKYVRAALTDPYIEYLARGACHLFSRDNSDPMSAAWAVFWFLKHRVKKTYDEATMFRLGVPNQQDLLTDPRVLLRTRDAAEDCDGFTMAAWALLRSIGVDVCMVTVACDPADRERWSHVFTMVKLPPAGETEGVWFPLDCSHGPRPGWMVPRAHITRWQAWNLDGQPIEAKPPSRSTLHGYVYRGRGMGDICTDPSTGDAIDCGSLPPVSTPPLLSNIPTSVSPGPLGAPVQLGTTAGTASWATGAGSNNWLGPLFNLLGTSAKVIQNETLPVGTVIRNADGSISANLGQAGAAAGLNLSSLLPTGISSSTLLLAGGVLLALFVVGSMMGGRK